MRPTNTHITCTILVIFITLSNGDQGKTEANCEDAKEILSGRVYYWRNWCFCRDTDDLYLYIWSEAVVLSLWMNTAVGWFKFIFDSKLMTMYSLGYFKNETNTVAEIILQNIRRMIKSTNHTQPILSHANSTKLFFGHWYMISRKEGEMNIQHISAKQVITLQEDFSGFTSESDGKKQTFWANISMGAEFSTSWITGRKTNQLRSKSEVPKPKTEHKSKLTNCSGLCSNNFDSESPEIQCHTKARLYNISYVWNIDRFDLHRTASNEETEIISPSFFSPAYDKIKWYLYIKSGNKTFDKISLFLFRCSNSTETRVRAIYSVTFLDSKGNLILTRTLEYLRTFKVYGIGWNDIPINEVVSSDNTLRIVCKIAVCKFTTNTFYLNRTDATNNPEIHSQNIVSSTKNSETSDVVLILSKTGKEYPANKAILVANSPVFAAMFNISHTEKGKDIDRVDITDVDSEQVFDEILRYIYTGKCENIGNLTSSLLVAAQKYKLDGLKTDCLEKIRKNLTVQNVVDTLILANEHGIGELKSKAIQFIAVNYAQVSNTSAWKQIVKTNSEFVHELCQILSNSFRIKETVEE